MSELRQDTCKGCGAKVLWARTEASGAWLSLDVTPAADGNVVLRHGRAHVLTKAELGPPGMFDGPPVTAIRYKPHRATCTNWPASNKR